MIKLLISIKNWFFPSFASNISKGSFTPPPNVLPPSPPPKESLTIYSTHYYDDPVNYYRTTVRYAHDRPTYPPFNTVGRAPLPDEELREYARQCDEYESSTNKVTYDGPLSRENRAKYQKGLDEAIAKLKAKGK